MTIILVKHRRRTAANCKIELNYKEMTLVFFFFLLEKSITLLLNLIDKKEMTLVFFFFIFEKSITLLLNLIHKKGNDTSFLFFFLKNR